VLELADIEPVVRAALEEDLRYGPDVTSRAVIPSGAVGVADVVARAAGVVAGLPVAAAVVDIAGAGSLTVVRSDGSAVLPGDVVATIKGPLRELLGAERTVLNFLTHLSGIATATRAWVDAVAGTGAAIRDTRKTLPGLRVLEKYAVRCGGGLNHRMGLGDAALIKDNHVAAAGGSVAAAYRAVRDLAPEVVVEVECDTLGQVGEALAAGATLVLLDNMPLPDMRAAVSMARAYPDARLEASGGLRLSSAREVALTGVHYLAVGALTHSSPALDLGLDLAV
jgi:nicotinate-nucleotide pyrophosphorylase (carboxylating)